MNSEEQKIRDLVSNWMEASRNHDTATVLKLMTDDVVFMVPGKEPFGKEEFRVTQETLEQAKVDGEFEIQEIEVVGDWAWMRNRLRVTITQPDGKSNERSGYTLTLLRRDGTGQWAIARDANLLS